MQNRGQQQYLSEFATAGAQSLQSLALERTKQQIEAELDLKACTLRGHRKYNSVTLPISVKYSVTGEAPNRQPLFAFAVPRPRSPAIMARPRSPQKHSKHDLEHDQLELMLDQTLLAIRKKLGALSSERAVMEHQMEALTSGIKEACLQCRRVSPLRHQNNTTLIRRVQSLNKVAVSPRTAKREAIPKEEVDSRVSNDSSSPRSLISAQSRDSLGESPVQSYKGSLSDSISSGLSYSSLSLSRSFHHRDSSLSSASSLSLNIRRLSTSNMEEDWLTIPELPESPRSTVSSNSSPFPPPRKTISPQYMKQQSSPASVHYHKNQPLHSGYRNSLPESVLNHVIRDDPTDSLSYADSLSQLSTCTDDGSPKPGSTLVLRRSSLTGQIEHFFRKSRPLVKRNSSFNTSLDKIGPPVRGPLSCSFGNIRDASRAERNAHRHRSRKPGYTSRMKRGPVILPSIETTV